MVTGSERSGGKRSPSPSSQLLPSGRRRTLTLRNRQRVCRVDLRLLRRTVEALLRQVWPEGGFDLAIYLVAAPEITRLNEAFLRHKGPTDVITFDYSEATGTAARRPRDSATASPPGKPFPFNPPSPVRQKDCPPLLQGEIFVCLDEAVAQACRFRTSWQRELVRYVVHGVLHLLGYDDRHGRARQQMKIAEDALVHQLARQSDLSRLNRLL